MTTVLHAIAQRIVDRYGQFGGNAGTLSPSVLFGTITSELMTAPELPLEAKAALQTVVLSDPGQGAKQAAEGPLEAQDESECAVCHREPARCCCRGIRTWAMSSYPGEYRLVHAHPDNGGEMFYSRAEVDALLDGLIAVWTARYAHATLMLRKDARPGVLDSTKEWDGYRRALRTCLTELQAKPPRPNPDAP